MRYLLVLLSITTMMIPPGQVYADVLWGQNIVVSAGESVDEAVVFGANIEIYGEVDGDAVAIMGEVHLKPGGSVNGDVVSVLGDTKVGRDGKIDGDVVSVLGSTHLGPNASISGDAINVLGGLRLDSGARVHGDKIQVGGKEMSGNFCGNGFAHGFPHTGFDDLLKTFLFGPFIGVLPAFGVFFVTLLSLFKLIVWCGIAMLIAWFLPEAVTRMSECGINAPVKVFVVGLITTILLPVFMVFFAITIIGIPITILLAMFTVIGYLVGYVGVAMWLGRRLPNAAQRTPALNVLLGVLVVGLLGFIPIVGLLTKIAIWLGAIGVIVLSRFGTKTCEVS